MHYYNDDYTEVQRENIIKKAKKIGKRTRYIYENFPFYDYEYLNNLTILDKTKFKDKKLFEEINLDFVYYMWFVNRCLFINYEDDIFEFTNDNTLRAKFNDETFKFLNEKEINYLKRELFYLDLVYFVLTDAKNKLQTSKIDNHYYQNDNIEDKKAIWHLLYYPVNLKVPV